MWGMVTRELPQDLFTLITCYTALELAKRLIYRVAELLSDRYTIVHIDNCNEYNALSIDEVEAKVKKHKLDVLANSTIASYSCDKKIG
ncbi:hypothetical protein N7513_005004 [Penicillium frequentans]|nr:hypothetical protein N7513_005004 [Penicillium glabrum]